MSNARFDLIETGGGDGSSTVVSPGLFKEFCLPYDKKIHNALHNSNQLAVYHTCGGMYGLFDLIISTNTDASETLTPKSQGGNIDGPELYEAMHGKVSLIGGLAQNMVENGTVDEIKKETHKLFEIFGRGGGYICSVCDHFFDAPVKNLIAFAEAAKDCKY
jgi:uroporphyrinogen decarboxylase